MNAVSELFGSGSANRQGPPASETDRRIVEILRILREHGINVTPVAIIDNEGREVEGKNQSSS